MSRRIWLCVPSLLLVSVSLAASTVPQLFQSAKQRFRLAAYADSLKMLDEVARVAGEPENDKYRTTLTPALAFYRGACLAALGRRDEARPEFEIYLTFEPNARLDPSIYSRKVIDALEEARRGLSKRRQAPEETGALAAVYRAFPAPQGDPETDLGEEWAQGPVRHLMTSEERKGFERLSDPISRSEFVTAFWRARDPRPETPENEFREEFERRVLFADTHFSQNEVRGSLTDRGMVFVLLGPPTYVGRQPIRTGEDANDPSGMVRFTHNDVVAVQKTMGISAATNVAIENMTGPANSMPDSSMRWREVWHYRRELLPVGVPYQQVDFEFITRKGYGLNVLQREDQALNTIAAARRPSANSAW
jgi:GWxTD domain-containing protein